MKIFYVKTTETCNLNCSHCFTSGKSGRKIFFDPVKTAMFVNNFHDEDCHFDFHGGEPMLAPLEDLYTFYNLVNPVISNATFGVTTNLTYKLDKPKIDFFTNVLNKRIATSWDQGIRWSDDRQFNLWESNVKKLISLGFTIKCFISLNTQLVNNTHPKELITMLVDLGIQEVAFERLTHDGSALKNPDIFPSNKSIDDWIYELHKLDMREAIFNCLLESIYAKFESGSDREGTFCRKCEQTMYTINADGRIAGCPNSAPTAHYASITDEFALINNNESRTCMIAEEAEVNMDCVSCPVFGECGGDCYKLEWDTQRPAPKKLMMELNGSNT